MDFNGSKSFIKLINIKTIFDWSKFDWSKYEAFNLENALKKVPYAEQEAFYLGFDNPTTSTSVDW